MRIHALTAKGDQIAIAKQEYRRSWSFTTTW